MYLDPVAADGKRFKFYAVQRGGAAAERARHDPNSYFHEIVTGEGVKSYLADNVMVTSADGFHWQLEPKARWGGPPWHPDPPVNCYYNHHRGEHVMMTRPGWGDRRIAVQTSPDARKWSNLELLMQPDPLDPPQTQFYGMRVVPYADSYLGLLWTAHFRSSERLERFNQLWGPIDCQLAYSYDGMNFHRGLREPLIPLNEPGQPGSGVVYPTTMLEHDGQLRIYSGASRDLHHQYVKSQFVRKGKQPPTAVIMHTLRKDGFMYFASRGNWASLTTKPLALFSPELRLNVLAPYGELALPGDRPALETDRRLHVRRLCAAERNRRAGRPASLPRQGRLERVVEPAHPAADEVPRSTDPRDAGPVSLARCPRRRAAQRWQTDRPGTVRLLTL